MKKTFTIAAIMGSMLGLLLTFHGSSLAARNASGTYSSPSADFVSGTVINSSTMNAKLTDLGTEITDSLSRTGKGGMLARLRGIDGTSALPAYSFTSETTLGLYRAGAADFRASSNSTDIQKWSSTAITLYQATTLEEGLTVTNSTANGAGTTSTGNGSGAGGVFTGGATGAGLTSTGGATGGRGITLQGTGANSGAFATGGPNSVGGTFTGGSGNAGGLDGFGTGTGAGLTGVGGATGVGVVGSGGATGGGGGVFIGTGNGAGATTTGSGSGSGLTSTGGPTGFGIDSTGGATTGAAGRFTAMGGNSSGVISQGVGTGSGLTSTGGATGPGVTGTGGATSGVGGTFTASGGNSAGVSGSGNGSGPGVDATGGATGVGGTFAAGTAATGGSPTYAVDLTNGYLRFNGVTAPSSTTAVSNAITPVNVIKSVATITTGVTPSIAAGFNVTSVANSGDDLVLTWASGFAAATYTCTVSIQYTPGGPDIIMPYIKARTTTTTTIGAVSQAGAVSDSSYTISAISGSIHVMCVGAQ